MNNRINFLISIE